MENRAQTAVDYFENGCNCAQAVFLTFCQDGGIDRETGARLTSVFGGGVAKSGNLCGALSGACLAISAKCGGGEGQGDRQAQAIGHVRELLKKFEAEFGAVNCADLLGCVPFSKAEFEAVLADKAGRTCCRDYVRRAVQLTEEILCQEAKA